MLSRWFQAHPKSVGETYWEHQRVALKFSGALLKAGFACLVHGLVPALFQTTASRTVLGLQESMAERQTHAAEAATRTEMKPLAAR